MEIKLIHSKKRWIAAILALFVIAIVVNLQFMDTVDNTTTGLVSIEYVDQEQQIISELEKMGIDEEDREIHEIYDSQGKGKFILRVIGYFFIFSVILAVFWLLYSGICWLTKNLGHPENSTGCHQDEETVPLRKDPDPATHQWAIRIMTLAIMGILFHVYLALFSEPDIHKKRITVHAEGDEEAIIKTIGKLERDDIEVYTRGLYSTWKHPVFFLITFSLFFRLLIGLAVYLGIFWSLLALFNHFGRTNKSPPPPTEPRKAPFLSKKISIDASLYSLAVLISFIWRFVALPWDAGGCFFHLWISLTSLIYFANMSNLNRFSQIIGRVIIFPLLLFILFGSLFFSSGAIIILVPAAIVMVAATSLWSLGKQSKAVLICLIIIPILILFQYSGFIRINEIINLRNLKTANVEKIEFYPSEQTIPLYSITKEDQIKDLISALRHTAPYSPNHERIPSPWYHVQIKLFSGDILKFKLAMGNGLHENTTWIELGITAKNNWAIYQNPRLYRTLKDLDLALWPDGSSHGTDDGAINLVLAFLFLILIGITATILTKQIQHIIGTLKK